MRENEIHIHKEEGGKVEKEIGQRKRERQWSQGNRRGGERGGDRVVRNEIPLHL